VATLLNLRRALRNGTVSIEHSLAFRDRETLFIPQPLWEERRRAHYRRLSLPTDPKAFLEPLAERARPACHRLVPQANLFTRSLVEPNEFSSRELVAARAIACKGPSWFGFGHRDPGRRSGKRFSVSDARSNHILELACLEHVQRALRGARKERRFEREESQAERASGIVSRTRTRPGTTRCGPTICSAGIRSPLEVCQASSCFSRIHFSTISGDSSSRVAACARSRTAASLVTRSEIRNRLRASGTRSCELVIFASAGRLWPADYVPYHLTLRSAERLIEESGLRCLPGVRRASLLSLHGGSRACATATRAFGGYDSWLSALLWLARWRLRTPTKQPWCDEAAWKSGGLS